MIQTDALSRSVESLKLSMRVRGSVGKMHARRLGDLCHLRQDELWRSGASQEAAAREIREALAPFGLALRPESTPDPDDRALLDDLLDRYLAGLRAELAHHPDPRCDIPISALGLGARADSWLLSHEFYTVGQVMGGGVEELWSRYGFDPSWADLVEAGPARDLLGEHEALVAAIARRSDRSAWSWGQGSRGKRPVRSDSSKSGAIRLASGPGSSA